MSVRNLMAVLLMCLMPLFTLAQGKGKGRSKDNKGKSANVHKQPKGVRVNKGKTVKVRNQRVDGYSGFKPKGGPPPWAPAHGYRAKQHVYFPDYHVFYDPYRGGYSYWNNNTWSFSQVIPAILGSVDLGRARVQLLSDIPLTTRPELYYNRYSTMYPARSVNISVPIPR
jgi:hypothetical protein